MRAPAWRNAQPLARPMCGICDDIDRAHPRAKYAAPDHDIEAGDQHSTHQGRRCDFAKGDERLHHDHWVGQRNGVKPQARSEVPFGPPDIKPWADQEQPKDGELGAAA